MLTKVPFKTDNLSSIKPSEANQYHLSLSLEWLKGCQFGCKGCHVNKEGVAAISSSQADDLSRWLDSMQGEANYLPTLVFVAPTDFLSASNTVEILQDPTTRNILTRFKRLSLQTTYLDITKIHEIKEVLHQHYTHMELELNFVVEPEHIENEKYLKKIIENRRQVYEILDWPMPVLSFCILNVYEYDRIKKSNVKKILHDYRILHDKIKDLFGTTIDFNFSMLRNGWWSNQDVEEAVRSISNIFDEGVASEFGQSLRFSFGNLEDSRIEKHYNWHDGHLYISPMVYERIVSFHDMLKIPMENKEDFSVSTTEAFENSLLLNQYHGSDDKPDCRNCQYLGSCIERNILTFMDMYKIKNCIIAKKAVDALNVPQ